MAWWTTERYAGPWRQTQRVAEMVFNEAHYRSWALLLRYSAEKHLIPRNFLLIPHKTRAAGAGTTPGGHDMLQDAASFAAIVRADEILSRSLTQLGAPGAALTEEALTNGDRYRQAFTAAGIPRNEMWTRALRLYRGFHGHGTSGDPDRGRDHDCPGPMFDWFRLAREVWDWWWHPFDFNAARTSTAVDRRPYSAGWNGNTRLTEHYYNVPAQAYRDRRHEGVHGNTGSPKTYRLEQGSRVYAQATGELVAARFPAETGRVSMAWMIVRSDVYHQLHPRAGQPAAGNQPAVSAGRINYGVEPTSVYTLYMHIGRPAGMTFDRVDPVNPDWLNRMLMRKKEADMGNRFRTTPQTQPGWTVPDVAWNNRPPGDAEEALRLRAGRPTIAEAWAEDSVVYTRRLDRLARGEVMLMGPGVWTTPVKVLLGDFLGVAGVILRTQQQAPLHGIRVEVFSRDLISTDFALTVTDAIRGWQPPAGATRPALRYPSEWEEPPEDEVMLFLELFGVDTSLMGWFGDFRSITQTNVMTPDDGRLPDAAIVHYDPDDFMAWLNDKTWRSEWPKYRLTDPLPATPRMRPAA